MKSKMHCISDALSDIEKPKKLKTKTEKEIEREEDEKNQKNFRKKYYEMNSLYSNIFYFNALLQQINLEPIIIIGLKIHNMK
ncbi:hypothetical protein [Bacillus thuringiensis]|uniref:hypothetical protein n=1 Tax=Bacillus thuringiensis TaxID=1428 RepID=UPI0021D64996|nr:hypothetical protein [Bacillus thuringiensis]MCU7668000.1 hypothetical protein [Bacillus thuringiensis]